MKVLFVTNLPSPYRVDFFNQLGKHCELTVLYERTSAADRDSRWVGHSAITYTEQYSGDWPVSTDKSLGFGLIRAIRKKKVDVLIISGYSSPSVMVLIAYCKAAKIPYWMEYDGGFDRPDSYAMRQIKRFLICGATGHFTTCVSHTLYLQKLGVDRQKIYRYPFSSVAQSECLEQPPTIQKKSLLRDSLKITEPHAVVVVGQYIHRKGIDVMLHAAGLLGSSVGIYIIGGNATEEYRLLAEQVGSNNIHFLQFVPRQQLFLWYQAADVFVLPTREDIWGLVINEAIANALPVVTTTQCIAGIELIKNRRSGILVPSDNPRQLAQAITEILDHPEKRNKMAHCALRKSREYTIETMVQAHLNVLRQLVEVQHES